MIKKAKAGRGSAEAGAAKDLTDAVFKSSHHIWLAGLGAFSRAQQEGMKMFEALVRQGERLQSRTRQAAVDTAAAARGAASAKAREVQEMANGTWDKLEQVFEDRVARALAKLGVYTQNDVQRLAERVDELSDAVNRLIKASRAEGAPKARAVGRKRTAGKKRAAAKNPAVAKKAPVAKKASDAK
jgi:poly(hydroxyalkanoate) granule-associated protein